jgi:hypothetical protein
MHLAQPNKYTINQFQRACDVGAFAVAVLNRDVPLGSEDRRIGLMRNHCGFFLISASVLFFQECGRYPSSV